MNDASTSAVETFVPRPLAQSQPVGVVLLCGRIETDVAMSAAAISLPRELAERQPRGIATVAATCVVVASPHRALEVLALSAIASRKH